MNLQCPNCKTTIEAGAAAPGSPIPCPACGRVFAAPARTPLVRVYRSRSTVGYLVTGWLLFGLSLLAAPVAGVAGIVGGVVLLLVCHIAADVVRSVGRK